MMNELFAVLRTVKRGGGVGKARMGVVRVGYSGGREWNALSCGTRDKRRMGVRLSWDPPPRPWALEDVSALMIQVVRWGGGGGGVHVK